MVIPTFIMIILATLLLIYWFILLNSANQDDWVIAAYNKVLDNQLKIDNLKFKEQEKIKALNGYNPIIIKIINIFSDNNKEIARLNNDSLQIQQGNFKKVSLFAISGYVLQRKFDYIGKSEFHKILLNKCTEFYGKKHAANKAKHILAQMLSYPIFGLAISLALSVIMFKNEDIKSALIVLCVGCMIVLVLTYAIYDEINDKIKKRRAAISRQFPNVVSKLALLVTSGMIMDRAWKETANSSEGELYMEMKRTAQELDNLVDSVTAYNNFLNRCNTKETTKLASAILQNLSKGNAEIGRLLKEMAHEAWQERRHSAKRASEAANSKLMIPTMLLFVAILIMIMVPVAMNFSSL